MEKNKKEFGFRTIFKAFLNAFNIKRGFIPTLRDLVLRPEKVINYYIDGDREKYFSPAKFFLIMSALFTAFYFLAGWNDLISEMFYIDPKGPASSESASKFIVFFKWIFMNPWAMILWITSFAFAGWIAFYKSSYNLAKQFVISIYSVSIVFFLLNFFSLIYLPFYDYADLSSESISQEPLYKILTIIYSLIPIIWVFFTLKMVFKLRGLKIILRMIFFCVLYLLFSFIMFFACMILFMKYG